MVEAELDADPPAPLLWSRGARRVLGWILVVAVVVPVAMGGVVLVIDMLAG